MTGVNLPMANFMQVAGRRIPTLVGLKYSHDDLVDLAACVALDDGRFEILFGKDEILLAALSLGVRGAVGSTYNFMSPLYQRVIHAFDAGDMPTARREQMRAVELVRTLLRFGPAFDGRRQARDEPAGGRLRTGPPAAASVVAGASHAARRTVDAAGL